MMWTLAFWKATAERAISTAAQSAGALLVANGTGILDTDWAAAASVTGMAALLSVLKSLAVNRVTGDGPGVTDAEQVVN